MGFHGAGFPFLPVYADHGLCESGCCSHCLPGVKLDLPTAINGQAYRPPLSPMVLQLCLPVKALNSGIGVCFINDMQGSGVISRTSASLLYGYLFR